MQKKYVVFKLGIDELKEQASYSIFPTLVGQQMFNDVETFCIISEASKCLTFLFFR